MVNLISRWACVERQRNVPFNISPNFTFTYVHVDAYFCQFTPFLPFLLTVRACQSAFHDDIRILNFFIYCFFLLVALLTDGIGRASIFSKKRAAKNLQFITILRISRLPRVNEVRD